MNARTIKGVVEIHRPGNRPPRLSVMAIVMSALSACGAPMPGIDHTIPPSASVGHVPSVPSATLASKAEVDGGAWSRHDLGIEGSRDLVIGTGGGGIVALVEGSDNETMAWRSTNGILWTGPATTTLRSKDVSDIQPTEVGFLAVGGEGFKGAAAWTSDDGIAWSRVPDQASLDATGVTSLLRILAVADGPAGYVAIGYEEVDVPDGPRSAVAWTSADGVIWRRSATIDADLYEVAWGAGTYVAVGQTEDRANGAIWTSPDGIAWTDRSSDPDLGQAFVRAVVSGGPGLVAIGAVTFAEPAIWVSTDGAAWDRVAVPAATADHGDFLLDIVSIQSTLVAVGSHGTSSDEKSAIAWTSPDGRSWSRSVAGQDAGSAIYGVVAVGERLVGIGPAMTGYSIWISPPAAAAQAPAAVTPPPVPPGMDDFFVTFCEIDAELRGAVPIDENGPAEALAWLAALLGDDPRAILEASGPIRAHLTAMSRIAAKGTDWAPGRDTVESVALLGQVLLKNLERIEQEARAGRVPAEGLDAYIDDIAAVAITVFAGHRNALPAEPAC